jgi:hypothetical protein
MMKIILFGFLFAFSGPITFGQSIDSLKLSDAEIPSGYSKSDQIICVTPHGCSFYDQTDLYESMFGKVVKKEFQSFYKKGDRGSILYLEFEKEFNGQSFLNGLLWGQESKPTKAEPDEYYSKGKILVIWSFNLKSELKLISKAKITQLLH